MKSLLGQLAILLGGAVATLSLVINLSRGMDWLIAAFRFALVFFFTVIILFLFLRIFSNIMIRFVAEKVLEQRAQDAPSEGGGKAASSAPREAGGS